MAEGKARLRDARDRLSQSDYEVGYFYYRQRWYPGAVDRFKTLLKQDPEYTNRDAVYFYLGEALVRGNQKPEGKAEALPYYEKLIEEFGQSEYLVDANKRIAELKSEGRGVLVLSAIIVFGHGASLSAQTPPGTLSAAEVAVACAPSLTVAPERPIAYGLRVVGGQDTVPRTLFGNLDVVVISGGTRDGVQLNQQYAIRRPYVFGRKYEGQLQTIHTTGCRRRQRDDRDCADRARLRRRTRRRSFGSVCHSGAGSRRRD
jgi:hypothetical protein